MEIVRTIWRWIVVGVVASALITVWIPPGQFEALAQHGRIVPMLLALLVSLPLYVCATASVPIAAALVAGGFPPGAALVFLMAGPATNLATIGAIRRFLGGRTLVAYLVAIVGGSVGLGLAFDFLLDATPAMAQHTHGAASWWKIGSAIALPAGPLRSGAPAPSLEIGKVPFPKWALDRNIGPQRLSCPRGKC